MINSEMSRVKLHSVIIQGFGSIVSPMDFQLYRKGLWFLKAPNGFGKSSIFSALSWCLYKVNLKGVTNDSIVSWEHVRGENWKGTRVAVTLSVGGYDYMIARHIKYKDSTIGVTGGSSLMIFRKPESEERRFVEEDLVGEAQHKGEQQEYINNLLGMDSQAFLASILFGQRMKRLIDSDNSDKRKLFETLFDLDFISSAKDKASAKQTEVEKLVDKLTVERDGISRDLDKFDSRIEEAEEWNRQAKEDAEEKLDALGDTVDKKKAKLKELKASLPDAEEKAAKYDKDKESKAYDFVSACKEKVTAAKEAVSDKKDALKAEIKKKYADLEEEIDDQITEAKEKKKTESKKAEDELEAISAGKKVAKTAYEDSLVVLDKANKSVSTCKSEIEKSVKEVERLEKSIETIDKTCPTCGQDVPKDAYDKAVKAVRELIAKEKEAQKELTVNFTSFEEAVKTAEKDRDDRKTVYDGFVIDCDEKEKEIEALKDKDYGVSLLDSRKDELSTKMEGEMDFSSNEDIVRLENACTACCTELDKAKVSYAAIKENNDRYYEASEHLVDLRSDIKVAEAALATAKQAFEDFEKQEVKLRDVTKIKAEKDALIVERKEAESKLEKQALYLERIKWWVTKGFGSGGIKAFVFSAMLNELNEQMEKYASRLGLRVRFSVDLSKASKPFITEVLKDGYSVDYAELSGGERNRVDIVLALGVHDVVSRQSSVNVLIMDEFSSGLDTEGYSVFMDLVRIKAKDKTVFLVEHNEAVDVSDAKFISLSKTNGSTVIEE